MERLKQFRFSDAQHLGRATPAHIPTMADTMATPCSYRLLPIARRTLKRPPKSFKLSRMSQCRAIKSNPANLRDCRRHLVRDQEAGGSNPPAPTNLFDYLAKIT